MFGFGINNKTIKELRKNKGYTSKELAERLKLETIEISSFDNCKLKDVPEPLYSKLLPILRGDDWDKIPWLK